VDHQLTNPITVSVTKNGCTQTDRINVTYIFPPVPFDLGPDTFFCDDIHYRLHVPDAHAVWSTGVIDSDIIVTAPGTYWALESNKCGTQTDTVKIGLEHSPQGFDLTASNTILCAGEPDTAILKATVTENQPSIHFIWSTGARDSLIFVSTIAVYDSGTYSVTVDNGKCSLTKTVTVGQEYCDSACLTKIAIPNIFSPNGDGKNDTFHLLHLCDFDPFTMHIYNRWGEKIFESHDIDMGWDGTYKGKQQPEEIYYWWVSMTTNTGKLHLRREKVGTVQLVR
jgi:gliding motility-associated-like protein